MNVPIAQPAANVIEISDTVREKLEALRNKLGVQDINLALDKSLNIAYFIADTVADPDKKLLIEKNGKFEQLKEIA